MTKQKKIIIASLFAMTILSKVSSKDISKTSQKDFQWNAVPTAGCNMLNLENGIASNIDKFRCNETTMMKNQYYCAYGEINATAVSLRAGYTFGGKLNSSLFLSVQGMYMF